MIKLFTYYLMFFILSHTKATEKKQLAALSSSSLGTHSNGIGDSQNKHWGFTKETMGIHERNYGDKLNLIPIKKLNKAKTREVLSVVNSHIC